MKYTHIEYIGNDGQQHAKNIEKAFWLAVISPVDFPSVNFHGINLGISIPHSGNDDAMSFYSDFLPNALKNTPVYLCGQDGAKVPVVFADGNFYEPKMGTSCIFCYVTPDSVGPDEHPKLKITGGYGTYALVGEKFGIFDKNGNPNV